MNRLFLPFYLCLVLLVLINEPAISQNHETTIKTQALEMVRALLKKDFEKFMRYIHPKLIELAGGKEKLVNQMDTANKIAIQFGGEIKKITLGHPYKVVKYKNELQSSLSETTEIKFMLGSITLETTLIAISTDGGKNWYFIDTSMNRVDKLKKVLPDLSPDLVIPPQKEPKIVFDKKMDSLH